MIDVAFLAWSNPKAREVPWRTYPEGSARVLTRWMTPKPYGEAGLSAHACASPAAPVGHTSVDAQMGFDATRVSTNGIKRPEGRGGGAG
jgi:hypothetical protein